MEFICDSMFGRLARALRMLGYSSEYVRDDNRVILFDPVYLEDRVIITTDPKRAFPAGEKLLFTELDPIKQLIFLRERYGLTSDNSFTICMECNTPLALAQKDEIKEKLPPGVYRDFEDFKVCPSCGRAYWEGTHYLAMKEKILKAGF